MSPILVIRSIINAEWANSGMLFLGNYVAAMVSCGATAISVLQTAMLQWNHCMQNCWWPVFLISVLSISSWITTVLLVWSVQLKKWKSPSTLTQPSLLFSFQRMQLQCCFVSACRMNKLFFLLKKCKMLCRICLVVTSKAGIPSMPLLKSIWTSGFFSDLSKLWSEVTESLVHEVMKPWCRKVAS